MPELTLAELQSAADHRCGLQATRRTALETLAIGVVVAGLGGLAWVTHDLLEAIRESIRGVTGAPGGPGLPVEATALGVAAAGLLALAGWLSVGQDPRVVRHAARAFAVLGVALLGAALLDGLLLSGGAPVGLLAGVLILASAGRIRRRAQRFGGPLAAPQPAARDALAQRIDAACRPDDAAVIRFNTHEAAFEGPWCARLGEDGVATVVAPRARDVRLLTRDAIDIVDSGAPVLFGTTRRATVTLGEQVYPLCSIETDALERFGRWKTPAPA